MIARRLEIGFGGPVATAAVALARLGHHVAISASVGDDDAGAQVTDALEREGVDTRLVVRRAGEHTARSIVLVDAESRARAIVTSAYRSRPEHVPLHVAPIIHVDQAGYTVARTALDVTGPRDRPRLSVDDGNPIEGMNWSGIWLYAPTVAMLRTHFGSGSVTDLAAAARAAGAELVVASNGSNGSIWCDADGEVRAPAFDVDVVSTLGAGDVFHGALLSALIDERPPADALAWANACAALSCRGLDGRSAIPTRSELESFLSDTLRSTEKP
jgi:sulfofructose kinase